MIFHKFVIDTIWFLLKILRKIEDKLIEIELKEYRREIGRAHV